MQRLRPSPHAQPAGDFGNRHGAGAPDWSRTAAPELPAFAGSRSRIPARPRFGDGNSAGQNFFRAVQPTFARRAARVRAEAGPAIRRNRRPNPNITRRQGSWRDRRPALGDGVASSHALRHRGAADPGQRGASNRGVSDGESLISGCVSPRRFSSALVTIFAGLALLLAAIGIYGLMSYTVSQRTQEIGLRMALGAQLASVQRMILGQTLKLTLLGLGLGLAGAFVVARFLTSMLFGVGVYDPVTFVGVAALLIAVALMAAYVPARRAMRVDPIVALRYE
ncbi:MAG: hypothetical protein DMG54_22950 [Acidobacteria bacterium]|nr:MAG: hypothetical protein DMG54_22950 [Acidobacteriota bacterium]PYU71859.1 MAG: hypothetical protein DMG52_21050 [Acidobacteriota bacterium]